MGRIADPVGDAIRKKEAEKAEADHLAAVRALPTPKELKAMEKKKAEDEWFDAASFLFLRVRLGGVGWHPTHTHTLVASRRADLTRYST